MVDGGVAPERVEPPLGADEVRVYTLNTGDRETVRAVAREVLAGLLFIGPDEIEFEYGAQGKPTVRNDVGLHFSISHSETFSMVAFTRVAPVGVDIERCRSVPNAETILRRFFKQADIESILSDDHREFRFAQVWTEGEARVKVRGASVWEAATPDPTVDVRPLEAPDGYAASIAVASHAWTIVQRTR